MAKHARNTLSPDRIPPVSDSAARSGYASTATSSGVRSVGAVVSRNILLIGGVLFALLLVVLMLLVVRSCTEGSADHPSSAEDRAAAYVTPFKWENLNREDGRWSYVVDGQVKSRLGVDVSENQHDIDWDAVADDGIDFAIVRIGYRGATEGGLYLDSSFYDNYWGARNAGLDVGVYFFSQAVSTEEAIEEADYVLSIMGGAELQYPIAFDSEDYVAGFTGRTDGLSNEEMTAIAQAFCDRIEAAGYSSMVYGNAHDLGRYNRSFKTAHRIWWAEYGSPTPLHNVDIVMWQYSNSGQVDGIPTNVDMDIDLSGCLP